MSVRGRSRETHNGVHPVLIAAHGLGHRRSLRDVGISRVVQQVVMAAQAPQQAIQQGEPIAIAVPDRRPRQLDEFRRDVETARRRFELQAVGRRCDQVGFAAWHGPVTSDGVTSFSASVRAAFASVEIGFAVEVMRCMDCLMQELSTTCRPDALLAHAPKSTPPSGVSIPGSRQGARPGMTAALPIHYSIL